MKSTIIASILVLFAGPLWAGPIESACNKSDRKAVSRALCGCIQDVADLTLSASEQRRAATFFADPHRTQIVRMSKSRRDEVFWKRYKAFGIQAKTYCG